MSKLNTELIHALQKKSIEEVFALVFDYAENIIQRCFFRLLRFLQN